MEKLQKNRTTINENESSMIKKTQEKIDISTTQERKQKILWEWKIRIT